MSGVNPRATNALPKPGDPYTKYTLVRDLDSKNSGKMPAVPLMERSKAVNIANATKGMSEKQLNFLKQMEKDSHIEGFNQDTYMEEKIKDPRERAQFQEILNNAFDPQIGGAESMRNIIDVQDDMKLNLGANIKGSPVHGSNGEPVTPDYYRMTVERAERNAAEEARRAKANAEHAAGRAAKEVGREVAEIAHVATKAARILGVGAAVVGPAIAGAAEAHAGGNTEEIARAAADATPAHIVIAAAEGNKAEAAISTVEYVPVVGMVVGEVARSLTNSFTDQAENRVEPGLSQMFGEYLGGKLYEALNGDPNLETSVDLTRLSAANADQVDPNATPATSPAAPAVPNGSRPSAPSA